MRVSDNTNYDVVRQSILRSKSRMEDLQQKSATLRKLNAPSDDPVGAAKVLEVRTDKVNIDQFQTNSKMAESFLQNTDHALESLSEILVRAKEIALGQASGASSNDSTRLGVSEEIKQLTQQAISVANTRIGDRYLFSGYKIDQAPVNEKGEYSGDRGEQMIEISKGIFLSANVPGIDAFNTAPEVSEDFERLNGIKKEDQNKPEEDQNTASSRELASTTKPIAKQNANIFQELENFRISLLTGDMEGIRDSLDRFDDLHTHVVTMRAKIGSRIKGLETTGQTLERNQVTNSQLTSTIEDADMAKVVSDMAKEEAVLKSALSTSQKLIQPRLIDFLR